MKEHKRKCFMCGSSNENPAITLHRFPKPGSKNYLRCELWAKFCFPHGKWSSPDFQMKLYSEHRMLCHTHFKESSYVDFTTKKLCRHAVPEENFVQITQTLPQHPIEPVPGPVQNTDTCDDNDNADDDSDTLVESNINLANMPRCINCWIAIPTTQQYRYNATHMDLEIISVLEEWIARQVIDADYLCPECVNLLILESNNRNEGNKGERQFGHDSVCVCCGISIARRTGRRSRQLNYGDAEWIYSANIISPLQMPSNARACNACWLRAHRVLQPPPPEESGFGLFVISTGSTDNEDIPPAPNPFFSGSSSVVEPPSSASTDIENILREPIEIKTITEALPTSKSALLLKPVEDLQLQDTPEKTQEWPTCSSAIVQNTDICDDDDNADDDSDTLVESNVCRVCLAMDVKMYDLNNIELREMFQNTTGIAVTENNHPILERLCWECAGRLKAAAAFRNKALFSDALLQGLANTGEQIRKNDITLIKDSEDYLKTAATLTVVEAFHTVDIDPENDGIPPVSENNDTKIVQNTLHEDFLKTNNERIIEEDNDQTDVENESMIEAPINTEMEYDQFDHICPNTGEESSNVFLETNPAFSSNIPLKEVTINSANSNPPPSCSHVKLKYPFLGYILKTPTDCEDKVKKNVIKITKRNSISRIVSRNSIQLISAKSKNINVKIGGISKKTSKLKLLKNTKVKANTPTDEESLRLEDFEF